MKIAKTIEASSIWTSRPQKLAAQSVQSTLLTPDQYKAERKKRGTQQEVAALLGLRRHTIICREKGRQPITKAAALALRAIPLKKNRVTAGVSRCSWSVVR